jgi:nucleoid-associated protein YgaU
VAAANTAPVANTGAAATPTPAATPITSPTPSAAPITSPTQPNAASMPTLPPGALLKRVDGLQDSWFADLKLYTWKEGDSWRAIANTYYGDWQRTDLLKRHNEGRMDVEPGETVFIPVFATERAAQTPNAAGAGSIAMTDAGAKEAAKKAAPSSTPTGKKIHVVANGESLWKIAKAELGDGNRWKEIYEANRDVLAKPESIKKGMRLRIP